jgi:hypothetical protein
MSIASQLPKDYDITIVGEFLPGDEMDPRYTSQWAGAIWLGTHNAPPREQRMQLEGLMGLWKIAETNPESSVRKITMREVVDYGSVEDVWYRKSCPDFEMMPKSELPEGAAYGMQYSTVILTPPVFLPWMRKNLEDRGIVFKRVQVKSLSDLGGMGHEVLINASGWGAASLEDVKEKNLVPVKQQNIRIRKPGYNRLYIRRGKGGYYSTAFARHDGTIYIGGIKTEGTVDPTPEDKLRDLVSMYEIPENQSSHKWPRYFAVSSKTSPMSSRPLNSKIMISSATTPLFGSTGLKSTAVLESNKKLSEDRR